MASTPEIIDAIEALAVHCRPPLMSVEQRAAWMADWCNDLAEFPLDAIVNGTRKWRQSEATKFPTPGQLLANIRLFVRLEGGEQVRVWRELSDAEYDALTVREKIRHRTILAHDARCKAGPMWRNGQAGADFKRPTAGHVHPDDMTSQWRKWTEIAEAHDREIKRLREVLQRPYAVAAE